MLASLVFRKGLDHGFLNDLEKDLRLWRRAKHIVGGEAAADIEFWNSHAGGFGNARGGLDVTHVMLWLRALGAGVKGEERRVTQSHDLLQQLHADVVGRAKLGGKIMGGGGAFARQHKADGDFNIFRGAYDIGDFCKFFAAVHDIALAFVDLVGISDLTTRLDRIVVMESGPWEQFC